MKPNGDDEVVEESKRVAAKIECPATTKQHI
jgi:hypothetical protein